MKEMGIPNNLDHPCITKVLEVHDSDKLFVIVMNLAPLHPLSTKENKNDKENMV